MLNVAILCAQGLGDALLMMIPTYHLLQQGHLVTFYYDQPEMLKPLFPHVTFSPYPKSADFATSFKEYDQILVENDHSERAWTLARLREQNILSSITFLLPTPSKYASSSQDYLFNPKLPVATNLQQATQKLLKIENATKENGITKPCGTKHLFSQRIALHPTSKDPKRNWKQSQFLALADALTALGYAPYFVLNEQEKSAWTPLEAQGYSLFIFSSMLQLSEFLYTSAALIGNDSGLGHLASNLGIPTLTLSGNPKRSRLWRPDWSSNILVTPWIPLPNFKGIGLNLRDKYWQNFVTVAKVLKDFNTLMLTHSAKGSHDT